MSAFSISVDPARDLVIIAGEGFFTLDDVARFASELAVVHRMLTCAPGRHVTLIDTTGINIQAQEVVAAFTAIARDPVLRSRRTAYVVAASLARGQARRLSEPGRTTVAYFNDYAAAEAWLFADVVSGARTASRYPHAQASPTSDGRDCIARSAA